MTAESKGSPSRVKRVVTLSSGKSTGCEHCEAPIQLGRLDESVNHYLTEHGYQLLHVGQETTEDHAGKPCQNTVAVLGSAAPPPPRQRSVPIETYMPEPEK